MPDTPRQLGLLSELPRPPSNRTGWPWTEEVSPAVYRGRAIWPRLSIVIPSFRQGAFIEEAIRSVLLQNYPSLELWVMDGGSTDATVDILARYSPWLAGHVIERDRGQTHALNKGYARATGEVYGWLNSDDYYLPGAFQAALRDFDGRAVMFGDHRTYDEVTHEVRDTRLHPVCAFQVAITYTITCHAAFWPAKAHLALDENLHFIMDADLFKRMALRGTPYRHVRAFLGVGRLHGDAKTSRMQETGRRETDEWFRRNLPWYSPLMWHAHRVFSKWQRYWYLKRRRDDAA